MCLIESLEDVPSFSTLFLKYKMTCSYNVCILNYEFKYILYHSLENTFDFIFHNSIFDFRHNLLCILLFSGLDINSSIIVSNCVKLQFHYWGSR